MQMKHFAFEKLIVESTLYRTSGDRVVSPTFNYILCVLINLIYSVTIFPLIRSVCGINVNIVPEDFQYII